MSTLESVLVTGGAGFVGAKLVPMLLDDGYDVRVMDNMKYQQPSLVDCFSYDNFEFIRGDVRKEDDVEQAVDGVDYIIHLASIVGAPSCRRDKTEARTVNVEGTKNVNDARSGDTGMVMASTGSVYGKIEGVCTEETEPGPLSVYGQTKLEAEQAVMDRGNALTYRPATAFGLSNRLRLDLLVNDFTYKAVKNGYLLLYDKNYRRTFIHVEDLARGFQHAVENFDDMKNEVYNIGHESMNFTKEEVCEKIEKYQDFSLHYTDAGGDPEKRDYEVSYEKIRSTGFETEVTLEDGIQRMIDAYEMINVQNPYSNYET